MAAPPPDLPAPGASASADAGFATDPSAASICGFKFPPRLRFSFGFVLPPISFPPPIPFPHLMFALNCDANNPLDVSVDVPYGGGRASNNDPDPDLDEAA